MIYKRKKYSFSFISYVLTVCLFVCCLFIMPKIKKQQSWQDVADTKFEQGIEKDENGQDMLVNYVSTPEQLAGAFEVASNAVYADDVSTITGTNTSSTKFVLSNNIDLKGKTWNPTEFKGTLFDGAYNTISNMKINTSTGSDIAFISKTKATIQNVIFSGVDISYTKANSAVVIGGVVAKLDSGGKIKNVMVTDGKISCVVATGITSRTMGGIVGRASGSEIFNCTNRAELLNGGHMAGIVGVLTENATISACFNYGKITANTYAPLRIGGIIGEATNTAGKITLCMNEGEISAISTCDMDVAVGGIVGYSSNLIEQCANMARVTAGNNNSSTVRCGGIVGYTGAEVTNCYNTGNITSFSKSVDIETTTSANIAQTSLGGYSWTTGALWWKESHTLTYYYSYDNESAEAYRKGGYAGGIVGYCTTQISNCYSDATISGGYEYNKTSSKFKMWTDDDGDSGSSDEVSITNQNLRLTVSPICGNIDNTNVSNVYYYGEIKTSLAIDDTYYNYSNIGDFAKTDTDGTTETDWSDNDADLEEGNIKNVAYYVTKNGIDIARKRWHDPPDVKGSARPPTWTWGGKGNKKYSAYKTIKYKEDEFARIKEVEAVNKACNTITKDNLGDSSGKIWVIDSEINKNRPCLKNIYWKYAS